jgi:S-DNA-T family DNA segregation ATPase FtsK/SpoIIIE
MPVKKSKSAKTASQHKIYNEIIGILIIGVSFFVGLSTYTASAGIAGYHIKQFLMGVFGLFAFLVPISLFLTGIALFYPFYKKIRLVKFLMFIGLLLVSMAVVHVAYLNYFALSDVFSFSTSSYELGIQAKGSGILLSPLVYWMYISIGKPGSIILLTVLFLVLFLLLSGLSLSYITSILAEFHESCKIKRQHTSKSSRKKEVISDGSKSFIGENIKADDIKSNGKPDISPLNQTFDTVKNAIKSSNADVNEIREIKILDSQKEKQEQLQDEKKENTVISRNTPYTIPPLNVLKSLSSKKSSKPQDKDVLTNAKLLEETLASFGISAKVVQVSKGPAITRYELQPAPGIKVSRIVSLSDDIALSLAAQAVRIEAPIPGKAAIGIEIPNQDITPVLLKEVLESEEFSSSQSKLVVGLGKDIAGNNIITDIARMPHLLIAGATGSGKSVCVNTLIISILYKATPEEVKMLMIDPKVVELNHYNGIPHLLVPVVTDPRKAAGALHWVVQEMTNRYKQFAEKGARDLERYNDLHEDNAEKLPKILVIIDELADLMMVAPSEVEDAICRLAQMARAAGIHLIIATQRPSVDVITGVIKANIPSRISFAVSSHIDSRTILDMGGAEKLLGRGDMLFYPVGLSKPIRIQGAYVSEKEVESVVSLIKNQNEQPKYNEAVFDEINTSFEMDTSKGSDEMLPQAIEIALDMEQISISMIQRRLRVGYARAARLIDEMEARGIISGADGSKPRNVLVNRESLENGKGGY